MFYLRQREERRQRQQRNHHRADVELAKIPTWCEQSECVIDQILGSSSDSEKEEEEVKQDSFEGIYRIEVQVHHNDNENKSENESEHVIINTNDGTVYYHK